MKLLNSLKYASALLTIVIASTASAGSLPFFDYEPGKPVRCLQAAIADAQQTLPAWANQGQASEVQVVLTNVARTNIYQDGTGEEYMIWSDMYFNGPNSAPHRYAELVVMRNVANCAVLVRKIQK